MGFNRDIVECKVIRECILVVVGVCFNRDIVECKGRNVDSVINY